MVWVIGSKGMLGTEICRQLTLTHIDYVATDLEVDIRNYDVLLHYGRSWNIKWIINCAAYTAVDKAETDIEFAKQLNEIAPANIGKVADMIGARIIYISTDYVFDGTGNTPRTEDMDVAPIGVYGVTKANGEKAVVENNEHHYIFRTAWLYGWSGKNFVYTMIKAMNTHDSIKVVNDQRGTPTFASDLASTILLLIEKEKHNRPENPTTPYGIYHCTDLGDISWWDFANEIKKQGIEAGWVTNNDCVVNACTTDEYPTPAKRPAYSVLSKDKIQNALELQLPDWKDSLHEFLTSELFEKDRIM